MKKITALAICIVLMFTFAVAETSSSIIAMYNVQAKVYGAKELSASMITGETEQLVSFSVDGSSIAFAAKDSDTYNSARIICGNEEDFLPYCICAVLCLNPSLEDVTSSFGNVLYSFLTVKGGTESSFGFFGGLLFNIKKEGENYRFLVGEP